MSEFAKITPSGIIVEHGGFALLSQREGAKLMQFSVYANSDAQFSMTDSNALVSGRVIFAQTLVAVVLLASCYSKIAIDVVEGILVNMITFAFIVWVKAENIFMQPRHLLSVLSRLVWNPSNCIKLLRNAIPYCVVLEAGKASIGVRGKSSDLALSQRHFNVVWSRHPQPPKLGTERWLLAQPMPLLYLGGM